MKRKYISIFLCVLTLLFFDGSKVWSQIIKGANGSETQMRAFEPGKQKISQLTAASKSILTADFPVEASPNNYFCLQFNETFNNEQEKLLTNAGISFVGFVGLNTYILKARNLDESLNTLADLLSKSTLSILGISDVPAAFKIKTSLYVYLKKGEDIPLSLCADGIYITVFDTSDLPALKSTLSTWNIRFKENTEIAASLIVDTKEALMLNRIAEIPYVSSIEERVIPVNEASFLMANITKKNQIDAVNYEMNGPIGRGVFFGQWETYGGRDDFPVSFRGREVAGKIDRTNNGHGTSVSLIVGGANNINEFEGHGMAPGIETFGMNDIISPKFAAGVGPNIAAGFTPLVSNHSVGWTAGDVSYSSSSAALDMATYTYPSFIMSYSSGNSGNTGNTFSGSILPNYSSITGSIKTNKNNFTVAGNLNVAEISPGSSFGPTADGRLKPDITAEGSGGTSFAAPGVTGLAAVLLEVYREKYGTPERTDVVKAVMLNTAIDIGNKGIDFITGFGQINPRKAVNAINNNMLAKDYTMPQGTAGVIEHQIQLPADLAEVRILLYWHDYPGTAGAARALVNNLDLEVITPDGATVLPWVLDATPARVNALPLQKVDSLNNVEQVTLENPAAGTYTIRVKGTSVVRGPQPFVLTWEMSPASIHLNSHPEGFKLSKNSELFVSWDLTTQTGITGKVVDIYFRANSAANWSKVASTTGKLYYRWASNALPSFMKSLAPTTTAQFRVVCQGLESTSGNCHYMHTPEKLHFKEFCSSQATLSWTPLANFNGRYIVYSLEDKYMEPIDSVTNVHNQITITPKPGKEFNNNSFFAIAARDNATGALSLRSTPITADPYNTSVDADVFSQDNYLCYGDTIRFMPNIADGIVSYYKNGVEIANQTAPLLLSINDAGSYTYKVSSNGCTWTSDPINIYSAGLVYTDTLNYGTYSWKGYVFRGGSSNAQPMYGSIPMFYGKFELDKLGFDSNVDLFPWNQTQNKINDYVGCLLPNNNNTTILKRKGFAKGTYTLRLRRGSLKMRMTIVRQGVVLLNYTAPDNVFTANIRTNIALDEHCEARIEWFGNHLILDIERQPTVTAVAPGNVKNDLSIWVDPALAVTDNVGFVQHIINGISQNTLIKPDRPNAGINVNLAGMNYNPTLQFSSQGGLIGGLDVMSAGNAVADFGVFKIDNSSPNSWARVFSAGKTNTKDWDSENSYVSMERIGSSSNIGSMRKNVQHAASSTTIGSWQVLQVQYNASTMKITNRGKPVRSVTNASNWPFNIEIFSVGAAFPISEGGAMKGQVAEIIHYNRAMTDAEEKKINSYLAIKYGLTLDHEYISASGKTVMPIETVYKHNVAGVVCDSIQNLIQKQSKSEETFPSDIVVGSLGNVAASIQLNTNSFVSDNTFMIWSHNNRLLHLNSTTQNLFRIWKLQANDKKQAIQFNFQKSRIPISSNENLRVALILSENEDLSSEVIYPMHEYTGGDGVVYLAAEIPVTNDVSYFTVGYRTMSDNQDVVNDNSVVLYNKKSKTIRIETQLDAVRVEILSLNGKTIINQPVNSKSIQILADDIATGGYIVRIVHANGMSSKHKLLIQ